MQIRQRTLIGAGAGLVVLILVIVLVASRGGDGSSDSTTTTAAPTTTKASADPSTTTTLPEDEAIDAFVEKAVELQDEWDAAYTVPSCEEGCDRVESNIFRTSVLLGLDLQNEIRILAAEVGLPDAAEDLDAATREASEVLEVISLAIAEPVCPVISTDAPCADDAAAAVPWLETVDGLIDDWVALEGG